MLPKITPTEEMDVDSDSQLSVEEESEEVASASKKLKAKDEVKKESKPGIVYLSVVPPKMNVSQIREYFSQYGEIHRSFLQPDEKAKQRSKKNQVFTEGWIEFKKRRHAKRVAAMLNNTPLGGKKKKQTYDFLWNIKYLPGLRWAHINERLAYERISRQQKMRAEIAGAKREASFFAKSVGLNKKQQRAMKKSSEAEVEESEKNESSKSAVFSAQVDDEKPANTSQPAVSSDRLKLFKMFFDQGQDS